MSLVTPITPCLWFDEQAEAAAAFYTSIFPRSKVTQIARYGEAGREFHGKVPGTVMTVAFELDGQRYTALNGGPMFKFNEAISLQVHCSTQQELDRYWDALSAGGEASAQQCGWLKDRYGLSWQIVPAVLAEMMSSEDAAKSGRVMTAIHGMRKLDIAQLEQAFRG